jgi:hypothetical protein
MLVDGGAAINLMSYFVFKKLGREDGELMKTNLALNGVGGNSMEAKDVVSMELTVGSKSLANYSVILGCKVTIVLFWVTIGFTLIGVCLLLCISF